jgi:hypothetical protein
LVTYAIAILINYVWEMVQMPLYQGMPFDQVRSYLLCFKAAIGDGNITLLIFLGGLLLFRDRRWPAGLTVWKAVYLVVTGCLVAVVIELLAVRQGRWTYSALMPLVPLLDIGLVPLLQLILLPYLSFCLSLKILAARTGK